MENLNPQQWRRVNELFHEVLELEEDRRGDWLSSLPPADASLRPEVESLIASYHEASSFLEKPAAAEFAQSLALAPKPGYQTGDLIGDFRILGTLGTGAFATVYLAQQISLQRPVALKVSPDFGDEARTMAALEHQHIVKVFSETRDPEANRRLLCMQYVAGTSLARILEAVPEGAELNGAEILRQIDGLQLGDTLFNPAALKDRETLQALDSLETVGWLGLRIAEALAYAHESGVLHLDVKPANILINPYGQPLLTDFNVAVRSRAVQEKKQTILGGTLDYMAPEHKRIFEGGGGTERIDHRADIYSLGLVLKQLLGKSQWANAAQGEPLRAILDCCLREDPRQRFRGIAQLVHALEGFVELRAIERRLPAPGPVTRITLRWPLLSLLFFTLAPQLLGSAVNIAYNSIRIVSALTLGQQQLFRSLCVVYNLAVYPLCLGLVILLILPMVRVLQSPPAVFEEPQTLEKLRKAAVLLPLRITAIGALGWMPGSVFFPWALGWLEGPLPPGVYGHFFISFTLSCLISMTYSFLYLQFVSLRLIYPRLCGGDAGIRETAQRELRAMEPTVRLFHFSAGLVPLLGAALVVALGPENLDAQHYEIYRWLVSLLLLGATVGILAAMRATGLLSRTFYALTGSG
jgi:serine/threonine protein kinase